MNEIEHNETAKEETQPAEMEEVQPVNETQAREQLKTGPACVRKKSGWLKDFVIWGMFENAWEIIITNIVMFSIIVLLLSILFYLVSKGCVAVFGRENILYCQGIREDIKKNISFCLFFSFVFFLFSAIPLSPFSFCKFFSPQIGACTRSKSVVS